MSRDEAGTRLGQVVSKRIDLALYRAGLGPRVPRLQPDPSTHPNFFLGKINEKDEPGHRAELLRTHLPQEADAIIRQADEICQHRFHLLGYQNLEYGPNINWHSDPVHGKSSRLRPWFKINFLDFHKVGDHKIIWELNRHQHLVVLAKAWALTGNQIYTSELVSQWYSWQKANPYPLGINWASTLEVAFRSSSWLWIRNLLTGHTGLPAAFKTDLLLALRLHGRYIERYLSTYFSPNTHLLGEVAALFFIGTLCPEISAAKGWQERGWKILLQESQRQVRSDGVYFEQALYYHVYALDFFLHARLLASKNGIVIPEPFDNRLKQMLDVVQTLSRFGPPEGFGDDDGGRLFNPRRNRIEHMTDPLALGAVLYDCAKYATAGLTEEAIWLFGDRAISVFEKATPEPTAVSTAFPAAGIYLMSDHEPCAQQFMIDAGPQGTGNSGHGHADALSLRFSLNRRRFLIDPGTYCYASDGGEREQFRGTAAHNTLRIDNLDQAVPAGPFAWSSLPNVKAETWINGQTFDFFSGSHDGYARLPDPVVHHRGVFHVKGGLWFVRDVAEGKGRHLLENFWHFAPDIFVREEGGILLAESSADGAAERSCMALLTDPNSAWTTDIVEGLVSPAYGSKQRALVVRSRANVDLPQESGVLFLPVTGASDIGTFSAVGESQLNSVRGYRYQTLASTEFMFFAHENVPWKCGLWTSDAKVLYCKLERGRFTQVIMVSGSFAEWRGKRFVSHPSPKESFEWMSDTGTTERSGLGGNVADAIVLNDFEVLDSVP